MATAGKDDKEGDKPLCVLKFGSSVLGRESDYAAVALEIYRHVRVGEKVVAVVSALDGQTDALLAQARRVGGDAADPAMTARLARIGEIQSAALLALALGKAGLRAVTLDPHEMGLVAEGPALDSNLVALDSDKILAAVAANDAVVVPGFIAGHAEHGLVTLGRGGTDLSAVFFADRLGAHRVRLIKDVDGVYAEDPARNPEAERYAEMDYALAEQASSGLIQPKAIHAANAKEVLIEVAALGSGEATRIARLAPVKATPHRRKRLRVALLGCGAVGGGVLDYLDAQPELFELAPVLVRDPARFAEPGRFASNIDLVLAERPDILIELMGGADRPADIIRSALLGGVQVVTANKAAIAKHWDSLGACAHHGGGELRYSAAVGGGVPIIEAVRRLDGLTEIAGVMNGTCNFILGAMGEGVSFGEALERAQALGFAEADPSGDVDGHDAADKLSILIREAFGIALPPERIARQSLRSVTPGAVREAAARGEVLKQVARCRHFGNGSLEASVRVLPLPAAHPLAAARREENCFLLTDAAGTVHRVFGKGAGRWPTAIAVFADVMDAQRALLGRDSRGAAERGPLRLTA